MSLETDNLIVGVIMALGIAVVFWMYLSTTDTEPPVAPVEKKEKKEKKKPAEKKVEKKAEKKSETKSETKTEAKAPAKADKKADSKKAAPKAEKKAEKKVEKKVEKKAKVTTSKNETRGDQVDFSPAAMGVQSNAEVRFGGGDKQEKTASVVELTKKEKKRLAAEGFEVVAETRKRNVSASPHNEDDEARDVLRKLANATARRGDRKKKDADGNEEDDADKPAKVYKGIVSESWENTGSKNWASGPSAGDDLDHDEWKAAGEQ